MAEEHPLTDRADAAAFDPYEMVRAFHERFDVAIAPRPARQDAETHALRSRLIREEADEALAALATGDIAEIAQELADLLYVTYGTAVSLGIDIRPVFAAVHAANMAKVGGVKRADGKVLKPPGWRPPDIRAILEAQGGAGDPSANTQPSGNGTATPSRGL